MHGKLNKKINKIFPTDKIRQIALCSNRVWRLSDKKQMWSHASENKNSITLTCYSTKQTGVCSKHLLIKSICLFQFKFKWFITWVCTDSSTHDIMLQTQYVSYDMDDEEKGIFYLPICFHLLFIHEPLYVQSFFYTSHPSVLNIPSEYHHISFFFFYFFYFRIMTSWNFYGFFHVFFVELKHSLVRYYITIRDLSENVMKEPTSLLHDITIKCAIIYCRGMRSVQSIVIFLWIIYTTHTHISVKTIHTDRWGYNAILFVFSAICLLEQQKCLKTFMGEEKYFCLLLIY